MSSLKSQTFDSPAEAAFYAEKTLPKLHKSTLALEPVMLKSALFRPAAGERQVFEQFVAVSTHGANKIQFSGEELRQDDERVLMALLKLRSGQTVDGVMTFVPRAFCRELGWADSGDSVAKLKASLSRLWIARVRIDYASGGTSLYSFVSDIDFNAGSWSVWLSPRLAAMFERHVTYLNVDERLAMKDGLMSWAYGFVRADACLAPFDLEELRLLAGQPGWEQKYFNRHFKAALEELRTLGVIKGFVMSGKRLVITK